MKSKLSRTICIGYKIPPGLFSIYKSESGKRLTVEIIMQDRQISNREGEEF